MIVLGASGKVGHELLILALAHPAFGRVVAPTRRPLPSDARLLNPIVDYRRLPQADWWAADACLCALGTTMRQAGSRDAFAEVDHDYVMAAARLARAAGTATFVLNSSLGANARSANFYLRVKGQTEDDLAGLGFSSLTLVRPSLLDAGVRPDRRIGEALGLRLAKLAAPALPKRYRAVPVATVARHMLDHAIAARPGRWVVESAQLV